jgi:hypothetical protein
MDNDFRLDVSYFPKELTFLLSIMKTENGESILPDNENSLGDIDWSKFLLLVMHHRVHPFIYSKLKKMDGIPSHVVQTLYQEYQKNTFQMLRLSGEMEQICKLFIEKNIRPLLLKGPVLAIDLYGDVSLRASRDLDILIPIDDLDKVEEVLLKQGYEKDGFTPTILNEWRWRQYHLTYFHPQKRLTLEIHWRLSHGPGKEPSFNELWERKRISPLTRYPVYYLGREDLFLYLVSHGARHGWFRLRWLADIDQLVRQKTDMSILSLLLKKYQCIHLGGQALILASQLLNTPISGEMQFLTVGNRPRQFAQEAIVYIKEIVDLHTNPSQELFRHHKRYLFSIKSNKQKIFFIVSFLYPYQEDAVTLRLPKHLHFLYFPLRPILWIWRTTKKHAISQGGT